MSKSSLRESYSHRHSYQSDPFETKSGGIRTNAMCEALALHDSESLQAMMNTEYYTKNIKTLPDELIYSLVLVVLQATCKNAKPTSDSMHMCIKKLIEDIRSSCVGVNIRHSLAIMCYVLQDGSMFEKICNGISLCCDPRYILCYDKDITVNTKSPISELANCRKYVGTGDNDPLDIIRFEIHRMLMTLDEYELSIKYVNMFIRFIEKTDEEDLTT
jgi:hypothetical protein